MQNIIIKTMPENVKKVSRKCVNKISEVLKDRGIETLRPNDEQLNYMDTTLKMWFKWVRKSADPELYQIPLISDFLNCSNEELLPTDKLIES